jgi:hypothetical protein
MTLLLAVTVAHADTRYTIQPIVRLGDSVAGINTRVNGGHLVILGLTDRGQMAFTTWVAELPNGVALIQYADGKFTPISVAGREGPIGTWPEDLVGYSPDAMNQHGNIVFTAAAYNGGDPVNLGTFFWEASSQKVRPVARPGAPASSDLTLEQPSWWSPAINDQNQIAFPAFAKNVAGVPLDVGIYLTSPEGPITPIAIPGQALPDGRRLAFTERPTINNAGVIAFRGVREGDAEDGRNHAFLWENGKITPLAIAGADAPGGGKFARIARAWVNDHNCSVLILALTNDPGSGPSGLHRVAEGQLTAVAVRGQEMPGGGQYRHIPLGQYGVSPPSPLGQHAFIATLADGATAAYVIDTEGKLSLILKSGTETQLGRITQIGTTTPSGLTRGGQGIGLNSRGQVALPVQIDGGPFTIVLLTPVAE